MKNPTLNLVIGFLLFCLGLAAFVTSIYFRPEDVRLEEAVNFDLPSGTWASECGDYDRNSGDLTLYDLDSAQATKIAAADYLIYFETWYSNSQLLTKYFYNENRIVLGPDYVPNPPNTPLLTTLFYNWEIRCARLISDTTLEITWQAGLRDIYALPLLIICFIGVMIMIGHKEIAKPHQPAEES